MRNPLRKRLLRELKEEAGKYAVIFLLMILSIGFIFTTTALRTITSKTVTSRPRRK